MLKAQILKGRDGNGNLVYATGTYGALKVYFGSVEDVEPLDPVDVILEEGFLPGRLLAAWAVFFTIDGKRDILKAEDDVALLFSKLQDGIGYVRLQDLVNHGISFEMRVISVMPTH